MWSYVAWGDASFSSSGTDLRVRDSVDSLVPFNTNIIANDGKVDNLKLAGKVTNGLIVDLSPSRVCADSSGYKINLVVK